MQTLEKKARIAEALRLQAKEGLDYRQIADRMGVAPPTASMYLREGRSRRRQVGMPRGRGTPERLSIRIAPDLYRLLDARLKAVNKGVRDPKGRISQRQVIEAALAAHLAQDADRNVYMMRRSDNGDSGAGKD